MVVLVTGATGLLGPYVVKSLIAHHQKVRCLIHTPGKERLFNDRSIEIRYGDILDKDSLIEASYGVDTVVHLANYNPSGHHQQKFGSIPDYNLEGTANLVEVFKNQQSFNHFILVSTLRSSRDPKSGLMYHKWHNEEQVINSGIPYTVLRSSILFGEFDFFVNSIAATIRLSPIIPVWGSGHNRLQPIAAEDLAKCISLTLNRTDLKGRRLDLGGPQHISYNKVVELVCEYMGKNRLLLHLPAWIIKPILSALKFLSNGPTNSLEKLNLRTDRNVTEPHSVRRYFGFTPKPLKGNIDYVDSINVRKAFLFWGT